VNVAVVKGEPARTTALEAAGHEAVVFEAPAGDGAATGGLAACLVEFEQRLSAGEAEAAAVSGDDDAQIALALVAAKLELRLLRLSSGEGDAETALGRVLALLADDVITA
jgi:hypothetical protein